MRTLDEFSRRGERWDTIQGQNNKGGGRDKKHPTKASSLSKLPLKGKAYTCEALYLVQAEEETESSLLS